jgi:hypothetical protein
VNPLDLKSMIFAKPAKHVVLMHFPIALLVVNVLLNCFYSGSRSQLCFHCVLHGDHRCDLDWTSFSSQSGQYVTFARFNPRSPDRFFVDVFH